MTEAKNEELSPNAYFAYDRFLNGKQSNQSSCCILNQYLKRLNAMADEKHVDILKQGVEVWNKWREDHPEIRNPDLSRANFSKADLTGINLREANLQEANFRFAILNGADLRKADLRRAILLAVKLCKAKLQEANLGDANLGGAILPLAILEDTDLFNANFFNADLSGAILYKAKLKRSNLSEANLTGANLTEANLQNAILVKTNIEQATLTGCSIYGLSAWDLKGIPLDQTKLIITEFNDSRVTVDDLQVAQFIYFMLTNKNVRNVIDILTSKAVLILGRFTEERKAVLDAVRNELRQRDYLPIIFDFEGSENRNLTETVSTLAHMAKFIVADITDPKSIPQELQAIIPNLRSVPIQPILLDTQQAYSMFKDFEDYPWLLPTYYYKDSNSLITSLEEKVIKPAVTWLVKRKKRLEAKRRQ